MFDEKSYNIKMDKAIEVFTKELSSLRTGRANAAMLDLVKVDVYGQQMPINQVGSITTPEPRMINIQVWDINNVSLVDAAIKKSDLGLNPQIDGQLIRLPVPELNEERRTELKKLIKSIGEKCKVSIRNIRREANEELKKLLKAKEIGEDEEKSSEKNVQTITDDHIKIVDEKSYNIKMDKAIEVFTKELSSLRTGRANASMLDLVKVDVYGQQMPINQVGSITTPEPRMINIQVWDTNNVQLVDAAIKKSDLGLNPQIDGQLIRLPIPELNEERRNELKKLIKSIGEKCKISIRNIRREANEELKKLLKAKEIGEDEEKSSEKNVQTITDDHIKVVDEKVSLKEKEIMTI